jgi:hypothetical protein
MGKKSQDVLIESPKKAKEEEVAEAREEGQPVKGKVMNQNLHTVLR